MAAVTQFDTLDYARKLETAGVAKAQAEAQARALAEVLGQSIASRADLQAIESNLGARMGAVESRLAIVESRIGLMESRVDAKIDGVHDQLNAGIYGTRDSLKVELGARIDRLSEAVHTIKWLFGLVATMNVAMFVRLWMH